MSSESCGTHAVADTPDDLRKSIVIHRADTAHVALELRAQLGEGPVWDDRRGALFFVDIDGSAVHEFAPSGGTHRSWTAPAPTSAVALTEAGDLLLAQGHNLLIQFWPPDTESVLVARVTNDSSIRLNDGAVDPWGSFVVGTMDRGANSAIGALYRLEPNGQVLR